MSLVWPVLIGAGFGAILGYYGQCSSGTCPLTSTWWRGALYGGVLGLTFGVLSPGRSAAEMNTSTQHVTKVTQADFDKVLAAAMTPVVVDFYAPWCGPCKVLAPRIDEAAEQFDGKLKFIKVNIDEASGLVSRFNISGVPTVMFFDKGKPVNTFVGLLSSGQLKQRLEALAGTGAVEKP